MSDFVDDAKLEEEFQAVMGQAEDLATLSFVFTNHTHKTTVAETMTIEDIGAPTENKTIVVGREYGTGLLTKVTIEYPEEEAK